MPVLYFSPYGFKMYDNYDGDIVFKNVVFFGVFGDFVLVGGLIVATSHFP